MVYHALAAVLLLIGGALYLVNSSRINGYFGNDRILLKVEKDATGVSLNTGLFP